MVYEKGKGGYFSRESSRSKDQGNGKTTLHVNIGLEGRSNIPLLMFQSISNQSLNMG